MGETANYITCASGHNVFVFRAHSGAFQFACERSCAPAEIAVSMHGSIRAKIVQKALLLDFLHHATCPKKHKVYVIWSAERKCFGFTCDVCNQHSPRAFTRSGMIELKMQEAKSA